MLSKSMYKDLDKYELTLLKMAHMGKHPELYSTRMMQDIFNEYLKLDLSDYNWLRENAEFERMI